MDVVSSLVMAAVIGVSIAAIGLLDAAEAAIGLLTRGRVHRLAESERPGSAALERLADRQGDLFATAALVRAAAYVSSAAVLTWMLDASYTQLPLWAAALAGAAIAGVVLFSVGEALPRSAGTRNPERVALAAAPFAVRAVGIAYPAARALSAPWLAFLRLVGAEPPGAVPWVTEEEYRSHPAAEEEDDAAREETHEAILEAVTSFAEKVVREVMVPRTDMTALEDVASAEDALAQIRESGYSRLPVFHETLDDIRGILYAKDLLLELGRNGEPASPAALARPAYFVPETKPVEELLVEMRSKTHMAIVADEYGGTAGLVTIEDLLEEIVGDIFDEYDRQVSLVTDLGDARFRVDARLPVDELNERFGTSLEVEADTVGGLFSELAGHIPEKGECLEVEGLRLVVEGLEGNRLRQLLVEPAVKRETEEER